MWSVFHAALDVERDRRGAFLDAACGGDAALRDELAGLLAGHEREDGPLDRSPVDAPPATAAPTDPLLDARLGPYLIHERIGEGGMGIVYDAEQEAPVRRRVALKVIRPGMHAEVVARFAVERQALALMTHPHIARVFDAGVTPDGRPFFVMEHVAGVPLSDYCDRHGLDLHRRIELFLAVCQAIEHAHQKGVIHRDIKPSNVLVAVEDGSATPKVIDFGVAKPMHPAAGSDARLTRHDVLIGTLEYMSPEQLDPAGLDVDTRSDIYSLGVVLYELLAGSLPFDWPAVRQAGLEGLRRLAHESDPATVSRRYGELGPGEREAVAKRRGTTAAVLQKQLAGDLDWILLKALERDRTRRYATASELGADLRRHLADEPVLAGPPRATYRLGKFVRRHRGGVAAAVAVAVLVVAFAVGTALQSREVRRALARADRERARAERVASFLTEVFEASDPYQAGGREATAREVLDRGADRVQRELAAEPDVQAAVLSAIGSVYSQLGLYDRAERLLRDALGIRRGLHAQEDHLELAESLEALGRIHARQADYPAAKGLFEEALAMRQRLFGPEDPRTARGLYLLGSLSRTIGDLQGAERLLQQALRMGRASGGRKVEHDTTAAILEELGGVAWRAGDFDGAEDRYREALRLRRMLPEDAPRVAATLGRLGSLLGEREPAEAEPLLREAIALAERHFGPHHREVAVPLNNLALLLHNRSDYAAAEPFYRRSLAIQRRLHGNRHHHTVASLNNLGLLAHDQGRLEEAAGLFQEALSIQREALGDTHPDLAYPATNLARVRHDQGRLAEAERLYRRGLELRAKLPGTHPARADSLAWFGKLLTDTDRGTEAEPLLREAIDIRAAAHGGDDWRTAEARNLLGACLAALGRHEEAEPLLLDGYLGLERQRGERYRRTLLALERVVRFYETAGRPQEATRYRAALDRQRPAS